MLMQPDDLDLIRADDDLLVDDGPGVAGEKPSTTTTPWWGGGGVDDDTSSNNTSLMRRTTLLIVTSSRELVPYRLVDPAASDEVSFLLIIYVVSDFFSWRTFVGQRHLCWENKI